MKKILALLMSFVMVFSLVACGGDGASKTGKMKAGTYTASVPGMNDKIEVSVEVSEDKIVSVAVGENSETPGIGSELKDKDGKVMEFGGKAPTVIIPEEIVKNQTVAVDLVTGATITSAAIVNGVKDCLTQAGANVEEWSTPAEYTTREGKTADVVVVGGGGAGLTAAIASAQAGKSVVIIEKNGEIGGDTLVCGAIYNSPNADLQKEVTMSEPVKATLEAALAEKPVNDEHAALQKEVQAQWDAYKAEGRTDLFDTKEWYALQTWINGDKEGNLDLVKTLCYNAYDGLKWIEDMGMQFSDTIGQGAGSLWQRTHTNLMPMGTGFMSVYSQQLENYKDLITYVGEATANELVVTDGKVTGVKAVDNHTDEVMEFTANDGVILATGGFAANGKMVQEYNTTGKWADLSKTATTNRIGCSQGDGITMAKDAGAALIDMEQIQLLYLGNVKDGQLTKYPPRDVNGTDQIMFINKEGKRFVQEDGRRDQICSRVIAQTDSMFYILESGNGDKYKDIKDPEWRSADGFTFDYLVDNGYVVYADTLEELAGKLGADPATLQATVDSFNACVDGAKDEFGRTLFSTKLTDGPWVATPRQACVHHTMGGVMIDTETHVLDEAGNIIPGLYAAGEVTGDIHGANRLGGNAVVDTVVFGKLAGDTLVADTNK